MLSGGTDNTLIHGRGTGRHRSVTTMDTTSPDVVAAVDAQTAALLHTARTLDSGRASSLCAGWTRGHVLTHVARNADGLAALVRSAVDGTGETMYTSPEDRDVERSARALAEQLTRLAPEHAELRLERTPGQFLVKAKNIPFMRLRELV